VTWHGASFDDEDPIADNPVVPLKESLREFLATHGGPLDETPHAVATSDCPNAAGNGGVKAPQCEGVPVP